jgi:hypothetical protein
VPGAPGMNVYPKIATKQEANHAEVPDFHCLLWPATSVQPCRVYPSFQGSPEKR